MTEFIDIYSDGDREKARIAARNIILLYALIALAALGVCIGFVMLYINYRFLLWLSVIVDFALGVAFFWFTVWTFFVWAPPRREIKRFFGTFESAQNSYFTGVYSGKSEISRVGHVDYTALVFEGEQQFSLLLLPGKLIPFNPGRRYNVKTIGDLLVAFSEDV